MHSTPDRVTRTPTPHSPAALSGSWLVDPQASHARFVAPTLAGLVKVRGRFRSLSGHLVVDAGHTAGALVLEASSVATGNGPRDRHLRAHEFLDAEHHPQLRYEVHAITVTDPGWARIDGELIVAAARTPLPLDLALRMPSDRVVALACRTAVDRVALGIRGVRGMMPRAVQLDVAITLRRATHVTVCASQ